MKSNTKEVQTKIMEHIMFHIDNDLRGFRNNIEAVKYCDIVSDYRAIRELVNGGLFLIYSTDQREFLNSLGINPDNKEYSSEKVYENYQHLIALKGEKLVKNIKSNE